MKRFGWAELVILCSLIGVGLSLYLRITRSSDAPTESISATEIHWCLGLLLAIAAWNIYQSLSTENTGFWRLTYLTQTAAATALLALTLNTFGSYEPVCQEKWDKFSARLDPSHAKLIESAFDYEDRASTPKNWCEYLRHRSDEDFLRSAKARVRWEHNPENEFPSSADLKLVVEEMNAKRLKENLAKLDCERALNGLAHTFRFPKLNGEILTCSE